MEPLLKTINICKTPFLGVFTVCLLAGTSLPAMAQQTSAAAMEIRFQQMEKEIRRLTGQLEEQQYEIRRLREDLGNVQTELDNVRASGGVMAGQNMPEIKQPSETLNAVDREVAPIVQQQQPKRNGSFQYNPPAGSVSNNNAQTLGTLHKSQNGSKSNAASGGAARAYDNAYSYIKSRDFARAEAAFAKFMKDYPNHDLVSNAKYWYGETFYVRKDYERAARVFAEGYQQYPKGAKAASNLLKLGMSLVGMGKKEDACIAFKQLKKDYSKSSIPVLKRADSEMAKINCR